MGQGETFLLAIFFACLRSIVSLCDPVCLALWNKKGTRWNMLDSKAEMARATAII